MGLRKYIKRLLIGDTRGMHPNSLANLKGGVTNEPTRTNREITKPSEESQRRTIETQNDDVERFQRSLDNDRPNKQNEEDTMNASEAFTLIKEFNSMQHQIIEAEASRRRAIREELMEIFENREEPQQNNSGGFEEEMLKEFAKMYFQKQAQQQASASPTTTFAPVPVAPVVEASPEVPAFNEEHAKLIAQDLRSRLPAFLLKQIEGGKIDEATALNYLSAWNIPPDNARMIYAQLIANERN